MLTKDELASYRYFRSRDYPACAALRYARAEAWLEANGQWSAASPPRHGSVRVTWQDDPDPDCSYLDQDCYTQKDRDDWKRRYNNGTLTVEGCTVEVLKVTPACAHCGRAESRVWKHAASLWGIGLLGDDPYRRDVEADLLAEAKWMLDEEET